MDELLKGFEDLHLDSSLKKSSSELASSQLNVPPCPKSSLSVELEANKESSLELDMGKGPSIMTVPLVKSRLLTKEGAVKRTWEITLGSLPDFVPGDAISIICPNSEKEVDLLIARIGVDGTMEVKISGSSKKKPDYLPDKGVSVKELLWKVLDIRIPPKKQLLRLFAEYASNESEKRRLLELCSKQGAAEYAKFVREAALSPLDILLTFKSIDIPFEKLIEHLPRLSPRAYSIASSPLASKDTFDVVFNTIEIPSGNGRVYGRQGVCTGWLEKICRDEGSPVQIPISSRSNNKFHLSENKDPIIMVGPGTGVAPFRGFIQHLALSKDGRKSTLLFGCRNRNLDCIYGNEFEEYAKNKTLTHYWPSFSRESPEDQIKYVQDNIVLYQKDIVSMLFDENGMFYVCGDARNMAKQVNEVLCSCVSKTLGISEDEGKKKVMDLILNKKYLVDVW